jgi:Ca-activated chloride channel family protein
VPCVLVSGLLCCLVPLTALAQARLSAEAPGATFRASTEIVALNVTVTDGREQHVPGLVVNDFVVLEEGVEQPVAYFAVSQAPLDLTLLVDASASMVDKIDIARVAVRGLTSRLRPGDRVALIEFRDRVVHLQPMTEDRDAVDRALDAITPQGDTALYNALYIALSGAESAFGGSSRRAGDPVRRQVLVVLSDGEDTSSLIGYEDVLECARRRGVTIYVVALRPTESMTALRARLNGGRSLAEADHSMRMLARETGGQSFFPSAVAQLQAIYLGIATELGQQYAIGYTPRDSTRDGEWRRVQVRVPTHPGARLRTRSGYFAEPGLSGLAAATRSATSSSH